MAVYLGSNKKEMISGLIKTSGTSGITPSGSLDITENGTFDVTNYASAVVNVSSSGDGDSSAQRKTVSVTIENSTVYGFDADGNPMTVASGTHDFLGGIILVRNITNTSFSGNFIIHPTYSSLVVFMSDGGTVSQHSSGGGAAN